jgi:hypothetical protein
VSKRASLVASADKPFFRNGGDLVDAADVAKRLGVDRSWVYETLASTARSR